MDLVDSERCESAPLNGMVRRSDMSQSTLHAGDGHCLKRACAAYMPFAALGRSEAGKIKGLNNPEKQRISCSDSLLFEKIQIIACKPKNK